MIDIRKLPFGLKELALKRKKEFDKKINKLDKDSDRSYNLFYAFDWEDTKENSIFWININNNNFDFYYDMVSKNIDNFSII